MAGREVFHCPNEIKTIDWLPGGKPAFDDQRKSGELATGPRPENRSPATPARARGAEVDRTVNTSEDSDLRAAMQRRLALKLAAGAGLSVAVAAVLVVVALGDGRPA